jgi:STE24 endopeptidase
VEGFTDAEVERARRYHRPRYAALGVELALTVATLCALTQLRLPLPYWAAALVPPPLVALCLALVRLPVGVWRQRRDRRYGLATQTVRGHLADTAKGAAVGAVIATVALASLFGLVRALPHGWPWAAAAGAALLVAGVSFLAPVLLEPIFNHFEPLGDVELAARLDELARRADTPVAAILVADASRRTTRRNAYVSGLGRTRRIVLWDTFLDEDADEIAVVVAHELGHRARRHVPLLVAVNVLAAAGFVGVMRLAWPQPEPADTAATALLGLGLELAAMPFLAALSRALERSADRFSLALTGDRAAYRRLHRRLALANLADLDPPRWLYAWLFTHPTAPERLADT